MRDLIQRLKELILCLQPLIPNHWIYYLSPSFALTSAVTSVLSVVLI